MYIHTLYISPSLPPPLSPPLSLFLSLSLSLSLFLSLSPSLSLSLHTHTHTSYDTFTSNNYYTPTYIPVHLLITYVYTPIAFTLLVAATKSQANEGVQWLSQTHTHNQCTGFISGPPSLPWKLAFPILNFYMGLPSFEFDLPPPPRLPLEVCCYVFAPALLSEVLK